MTQTSSFKSDAQNNLKSLIKKNPGNPKLQKLPNTQRENLLQMRKKLDAEPIISSSSDDFGRDEELIVDNHLLRQSLEDKQSIYQRAMASMKEKNPIVWPTRVDMLKDSGTILFGDSMRVSKTFKNNNINFNAIDFLLQEKREN